MMALWLVAAYHHFLLVEENLSHPAVDYQPHLAVELHRWLVASVVG